jgi:hypothetical protein
MHNTDNAHSHCDLVRAQAMAHKFFMILHTHTLMMEELCKMNEEEETTQENDNGIEEDIRETKKLY